LARLSQKKLMPCFSLDASPWKSHDARLLPASGQASSSRLRIGRIVERVHEDAAHGVDDERALAVLGVDERRAAPGRAFRIIHRADQPRRALDEHQRLALIPGVIAECDGIGAGVEEFLIDRLGDANPPAAFSPLATTRSSPVSTMPG
jgi:hypothetical protein